MDEGAFNTTGKSKIEEYLWGVATNSSENTFTVGSYGRDFVQGYPADDAENYAFERLTETDGQIIHLQEWARVIPESFSGQFKTDLLYRTNYWGTTYYFYLWLNWPESYSQKINMAKETVKASMATKGGTADNKLFVNSLCCFYPIKNLGTSYYPYATKYEYGINLGIGRTVSFSLDNAGSGGDYVTCAYDLNMWFYNWLTENEDKQQGPVGLVMLNHIGNTKDHSDDKSLDLVNWILMNNFKFPLATKQDPASANYDNEIEDGGNAIDFAN